MTAVPRLAAGIAATVLLLTPALWNRWPIIYFDTGGYLARWYEGTLEFGRSIVYALFLTAGVPLAFWPVIAVQAALAVWTIALTLRAHGFGAPRALIGTIVVLALATSLPWLASQLIADIFAGLAVLALHLLLFRAGVLTRAERIGLIALLAFAVATHNATLAVVLALLAAAALLWLLRRDLVPLVGFARATVALAVGALAIPSANLAVTGQFAWTPGGTYVLFGRLAQDGIVQRYLAEHCPDPRLRLCDHQAEIPRNAEMFLWGHGVFERLGGFPGLGPEMDLIVRESIRAYPLEQIKTALAATAQQLVLVRTGDGLDQWLPHTYDMIGKHTPQLVPGMRAARQQNKEFGFDAINRLHVPVVLGSMLLLPLVLALALRRRDVDLGLLAATAVVVLLANAVVCGALSNPHDRYGARLAWIATLVAIVAALRLRRSPT